jgi:sporulation protein YunB
MIECTAENILYKKRRKFSFKKTLVFFVIILIIILCFLYYKFVIAKQIFNICTDYAYSYSTEAVNLTVLNSYGLDTDYSNLISVEKNKDGEIVLMSADAQKINLINKKIAVGTENVLKNKLKNVIPIPFFSFMGANLLYGYGPIILYKAIAVSSVTCNFSSSFYSVGINQTLHSIYVEVECEIKIKSLFNSKVEKCNNKILISEAVLVGKVPDIYLNGKLFGQ